MITLHEHITERSEIQKDNLPKGVLARVYYKIMRFGKKNANNRVYERGCAEQVLADPNVHKKLNTRTLYGDQEHPELSQLKLNWQTTSHIISELRINEADQTLEAAFDILPTEPGKFINVLLEAGCQVGVSTRADGELQEALDENGQKYSRVVPEKYIFKSVDFTGDPSTPDTLPEKIIRATQYNYESRNIDKNVAMALLEYVNTPESQELLEKVRNDSDTPESIPVKEDSIVNTVKVGSAVKINERVGVVSHIFPRTQKAIVQFATSKETVSVKECVLLEELSAIDSETEKVALKLFSKSYRDLTFQEKEQVLDAQEDLKEIPQVPPQKQDVDVEDSKGIEGDADIDSGVYRGEDGGVYFVKEVVDGKVVMLPKKSGEIEVITVDEFKDLHLERDSEDTVTFEEFEKIVNDKLNSERSEDTEMEEAISKVLGGEEDIKEVEPNLQEFKENLLSKSDHFLNDIPQDLIETWSEGQREIFNCIISERSLEKHSNISKSIDYDTDRYINEIISKEVIIKEKDDIIETLQYKLKTINERFQEAENCKGNLQKEIIELKGSTLKLEGIYSAKINLLEEASEHSKKNYESKISDLDSKYTKQLEKNKKLKESLDTFQKESTSTITALKESHQRDLIKVYTQFKVKSIGLKLPKTTIEILENCKTYEDVDNLIRQTQEAIREGIVHSTSVSEIVQKSGITTDPTQKRIDNTVTNILKNLGV